VLIGQIGELIVLFTNNGQKKFNVTSTEGSLNYAADISIYLQNFTRNDHGVIVNPSEQVAFSFFFRPDPQLEPMRFGFLANVYYVDEDNVNYTSTFFNSTIQLDEVESTFDVKNLFTYFLGLGVLGLIGFVIFKFSGFKKSKRSRIETGTKSEDWSNEWLQGTNLRNSSGSLKNSGVKKRK